MMKLEVSFDREDRCYKFGDEVTGNVAIEATSDVDCSEVGITHGWGTHGRGYPDGLHERHIFPAGSISLRAGESRRFPFRFRVPSGPVSYHGHYVNVDWFVAAHVKTSTGKVLKEEQDFLLPGGEPTGTIFLGAREIEPRDIPDLLPALLSSSTSTVETVAVHPAPRRIVSAGKALFSFVYLIVLFELILIGFIALQSSSKWTFAIFGLVIALAVLWYGLPKAIQRIAESRLELSEFRVQPDIVGRGRRVNCHVGLHTKASVHVRNIRFTLYAQERVTRPIATASTTDYHIVQELVFVRALDEELPAGKQVSFDDVVPLEEDMAPTFSARNNSLDWYMKATLELKGWPDLMATLPITILP